MERLVVVLLVAEVVNDLEPELLDSEPQALDPLALDLCDWADAGSLR
jgi:hypothetical protein